MTFSFHPTYCPPYLLKTDAILDITRLPRLSSPLPPLCMATIRLVILLITGDLLCPLSVSTSYKIVHDLCHIIHDQLLLRHFICTYYYVRFYSLHSISIRIQNIFIGWNCYVFICFSTSLQIFPFIGICALLLFMIPLFPIITDC